MSNSSDLKQSEAQACIAEIKKLLLIKGQWFKVIEEYNSKGVKFYRVEASLKVRQ